MLFWVQFLQLTGIEVKTSRNAKTNVAKFSRHLNGCHLGLQNGCHFETFKKSLWKCHGKHVYDCALLVGLTNLWWLSYKYGAKICRHFVIFYKIKTSLPRDVKKMTYFAVIHSITVKLCN